MIYIGIDPGQKGSSCILGFDEPIFCGPGVEGLISALFVTNYAGIHVVLEKSHAMKGQGVSSTFTFAQGYGELIGALKACKIAYTCVHPRTWTKVMLQGVPTRFEGKQRAAYAAAQLFPTIDLRRTPKCKKPDEGMVDALLIAEWGRRTLNL